MTMIGITIVFIMMFLRIRALYWEFISIQAFVFAILLTFITINSYALTHGIPVKHPDPSLVDSCTMIVDTRIGRPLASSTAWLPLLYDTVIVSLTVYRTASSVYYKTASNLLRVMLREGLLYYSVICTITLILTIMINSATQSIRNITSQYARFHLYPPVHGSSTIVRSLCLLRLHLCLTVAMMSRITWTLSVTPVAPILISSITTQLHSSTATIMSIITRPPSRVCHSHHRQPCRRCPLSTHRSPKCGPCHLFLASHDQRMQRSWGTGHTWRWRPFRQRCRQRCKRT
ncbi:hypothetical protein BJV77DRAFT_802734 [Russula vinacea]|nr:hypothetical protein BJV77DRAFT_802734 [Russula vinacea]